MSSVFPGVVVSLVCLCSSVSTAMSSGCVVFVVDGWGSVLVNVLRFPDTLLVSVMGVGVDSIVGLSVTCVFSACWK